jgi:hypothetical protein
MCVVVGVVVVSDCDVWGLVASWKVGELSDVSEIKGPKMGKKDEKYKNEICFDLRDIIACGFQELLCCLSCLESLVLVFV